MATISATVKGQPSVNVTIKQASAVTTTIGQASSITPSIAGRGPQGPTGPTGATGATGPAGPSDHTLLTNIGTNTHSQIDTHLANTSNPHSVTKAQVGLSNVDNTSDASKPVSTATQTALDLKANDADVVHDTGNETVAGVKTFSSDPLIPDEAYGVGWNGSLEPATKNALYDKIETIEGGGGGGGISEELALAYATAL